MVIFILFILSMCIYMFKMPADEYDHQYYEKGLNFDKDFAKEKQVQTDHAQPVIMVNGDVVNIGFAKAATGTARFLRPSSQDADKVLELDGSPNEQLPVKNLARGRWQLIINWTSDRKSYLYQQEIYLK